MTRRILSSVLIVAIMFVLAACGNEQAAEETSAMSLTETDNMEKATEEMEENGTESDMNHSEENAEVLVSESETDDFTQEEETMKMNVQVGSSTFTATLESNEAVNALMEMMESSSITICMSDYAGFEKVGALGTSLPANDSQTTTQAGDIVLYSSNQIVIFYGSNSWAYTRLGHIDDLTGWEDALGSGDVEVTFSLD
ncbi:MAG: hypothetical protein LUF27_09760 [Lachnospiraceae bacterium]|nr:hypothetical protein [Lachnospiraceae bacterium]